MVRHPYSRGKKPHVLCLDRREANIVSTVGWDFARLAKRIIGSRTVTGNPKQTYKNTGHTEIE